MKIATLLPLPWKSHLPISQQPTSESSDPAKPFFFLKFGWLFNAPSPPPPSQQKGGGSAHYVVPGVPMIMLLKVLKYFSSGKISFFLFATLWLQDFKQKKIYVFFSQNPQSHTTVTLNRKWVVIPRKNVGLYLEFVLLGS